MTTAAVAPERATDLQLMQLLSGKWISKAISVAADLGVADLLAQGPASADELAAMTGTHAPSLYRLLRALTLPGVLAELPGRRFELTPLGQHLRTDAEHSMRNAARLIGSDWATRCWDQLLYSVKTGESAMKRAWGMEAFDYLARNSSDAAVFDAAMTDYSRMLAPAIAEAYYFGKFRHIVDVAGGHGTLLSTILNEYPQPRGTVFDLPQVVEGTRRALRVARLEHRCNAVAGSFFDSVPSGADAYMMKSIIHDWDDERALAILRNCRRAIDPRGRLLLCELVVPGPGETSLAAILDLEMMLIPGGKERTANEYAGLLAAAGFRLITVHPTASPMSVIEAEPVIS